MSEYLIKEAKCNASLEDTLNQTCLFYVSRDGREDLCRLFLEHGCKANHVDSYGQTPIFYTAREGHRNIMQMLIEKGGDPDHVDNDGQTPIFYAVRSGNQDCIDYLLKECEPDLTRNDNKGQNIIHQAYKYRKQYLIDELVAAGVPLPTDVKRKLAMATQKSSSRGKKNSAEPDAQSENPENNVSEVKEKSKDQTSESVVTKSQPVHTMGSRSRGIRGQPIPEPDYF